MSAFFFFFFVILCWPITTIAEGPPCAKAWQNQGPNSRTSSRKEVGEKETAVSFDERGTISLWRNYNRNTQGAALGLSSLMFLQVPLICKASVLLVFAHSIKETGPIFLGEACKAKNWRRRCQETLKWDEIQSYSTQDHTFVE